MKNRHFIELEEYHYFISTIARKTNYDDEDFESFNDIYQNASNLWELEIISNNYFYAKIIDRLNKNSSLDCEYTTNEYYSLMEKINFSINECDFDFVDKLMNHLPNQGLSLDENLNHFIKSNPNV